MPRSLVRSLVYLLSLFLLGACGGGGGGDAPAPEMPTISHLYPGAGIDIEHVATPQTDSDDLQFTYKLDLGASTSEVYFIFTNTSLLNLGSAPLVADTFTADLMGQVVSQTEEMSAWARANEVGLPDRLDVSLFNSNPELYGNLQMTEAPQGRTLALMAQPAAPILDVVGDTSSFSLDQAGTQTLIATCRKVTVANDRTLNIWVAEDSWVDTCARTNCLNQAMVDVLGDKFLLAGNDNDIFEWVSNIFGVEWGTQSFANLIGVDENITILLYDIDSDNSVAGGVLGFFWSKDNFINSGTNGIPGSNQRIMFYLDAVLFATAEGPHWNPGDRWPDKIISTLAHEFQHMINYYQKSVLQMASSETWLNEMSSMVAEDLLETKAAINGPRGVSYLDGTAGNPGNHTGRLPRAVRFDYLPVAEWLSGSSSDLGDTNVLNSYAINYSYGAFLARNYGGPGLFRAIVQNNQSGSAAITLGLATAGFPEESFASTLQKWGVGVLLSDDAGTNVPSGYRYNTGGFNTTLFGTSTYDLGSINLYNYTYPGQVGPRIYDNLPPADLSAGLYKTSNLYYRVGTGLSGKISRNITLRKGQKLSVLVR